MPSPYPGGFDNFPIDITDANVDATDHHNDLADAINKMQVTLGLNPAVALAHTPFGPDLVTGDSQTFLTGLGDWVEVGGGTLVWVDVDFLGPPLNSKVTPEGLQFEAAGSGDKISLPLVGTFTTGQPYVAMFLLKSSASPSGPWLTFFGEGSEVDGVTGEFVEGGWRLEAVSWTPVSDHSDAKVEISYNGSDTSTLHMFYCKVAEKRDSDIAVGFDLAGANGGSLYDRSSSLNANFADIDLRAENIIGLAAGLKVDLITDSLDVQATSDIVLETVSLYLFDPPGITPGLGKFDRPALATATNEGEVIVGYNLIRTMLISLGLATDGD